MAWAAVAVVAHLAVFLSIDQFSDGEALRSVHDAGFYITHLRDPLLTGSIPTWWDNVPYRGLRVGYVVLALPFRWLGEVPALLTVHLIALGLGVLAIRRVAQIHGMDPRWPTIAWILNPGAVICTVLLLPDVIAWTAILWCLVMLNARRWVIATALGIVATATKEASLAALALAGVSAARDDRRTLLPAGAGVVWHLSYFALLVSRFGSSAHTEYLTLPLTGWVEAVGRWDERPISRIVGISCFALGLVVLAKWWRSKSFFVAAAAGQALLMLGLTAEVVIPLSNSTRVAGLFLPLLFATPSSEMSGATSRSANRSRARQLESSDGPFGQAVMGEGR